MPPARHPPKRKRRYRYRHRHNLVGLRSGKLLITKRAPDQYLTSGRFKGKAVCRWYVRCECGGKNIVRESDLTRGFGSNERQKWGPVSSCGCLNHRTGKDNPNYKNGAHREFKREKNSWAAMRDRCYRRKNSTYENYGGQGITVCDRWRDPENGFKNFLIDMGRRPEGTSLDRINVLGNYEPRNCRWSTYKVQAQNRRCMYTEEQLAELAVKAAQIGGDSVMAEDAMMGVF
jgi:hypothetical protein